MSILKINIPLTIGIYHSKEFTWGGEKIPYYEKKNRVLFFNYLNQKNLVFFNEKLVSSYEDTIGYSLNEVNTFPIGVVDLKSEDIQYKPIRNGEITIGSVGRLVGFKAYNLWMIDIINILIKKGIKAQYLVYGEGPLKEEMQRKINALGLQNSVFLKGHLEYSLFPQVVRELDVFVGSGTAIVEAASLGVPSLVGIESVSEPLTYGFLADVPGFTYNEDNVHPKVSALDKFIEFIEMNAKDVTSLQVAHYNKSKIFSMKTCVENFDRITPLALDSSIVKKHAAFYFRLSYSLSFFLFALLSRIKGKSMAITMYD